MKKEDRGARRKIIIGGTAMAATSAFSIIGSRALRSTQANSKVEIGWIGCGEQGERDARMLEATKQAKIVALGDYFQDQLDRARTAFQIEQKNSFCGLDAFRAVIESKVDAVLLTTPPGFRPEHFRAAVAAGKHVFMEKPVAVDVAGCQSVAADGAQARAQNLTVVVGLQRHYSKAYRRCKELIDQGVLGQIVSARSFWAQGDLWRREKREQMPSQFDYEVRNWYYFRWLSGDHIVEQNIHNLDVINWMLKMTPVSAIGYGGVAARHDIGNIFDHFSVVYEYPGGILSTDTTAQVNGVRKEVGEEIHGTRGTFSTMAGKGGTASQLIEGVKKKKDQEAPILFSYDRKDDKHYAQEAEAFISSVKGTGEHRNDTDYGVTSTFTAILGREAACRRERVGWNDLWASGQRLSFTG